MISLTANAINLASAIHYPQQAPVPAPGGEGGGAFDPNSVTQQAPPGSTQIYTLLGYGAWIVAAVIAIAFLIVIGRIAFASGSSHGGHGLGKAAGFLGVAMILFASMGAILTNLI